ncbi:MAG TPA: hypothetical protein PKJ37_00680 [Acidobacteriota bacterium]|nr:hypothetical protein [Acidobacteriota bacterium]HNT16394.1 hypothetical protein [Acidobacteriota bacterium]
MAEIDEIKVLYEELQGYLSQTPMPVHPRDSFPPQSQTCWENINHIIDELEKLTGDSMARFKIVPTSSGGFEFISLADYRGKLNGLINRLYAKYFSHEEKPFSGGPSTVISQSQSQNQSIQMLLEIRTIIDKNIDAHKEGTPQKGFMEKLRKGLSSVKSVAELLALIWALAKEFKLGIDEISKLLT